MKIDLVFLRGFNIWNVVSFIISCCFVCFGYIWRW